MARNNPKPTEKVDWINDDDPVKIISPTAAQKLAGWAKDLLPPAERFNWFWNLLSNQQIYSNAQVEDWIVIDSDADEGDYATLAAYLADAPAAGDRVLIKEDQTVTVQTIIPANITLKFLDGARLLCATNIATSVLQLNDNAIIEGVLNIVLSHTGTTAKAVEYNGDNATGKINVENSSTGTLTTAHHINANKTGNKVTGFVDNTGGGVLTNVYIDNSTEDSNKLEIVDGVNNQVRRSRGAYKFRDGLEFDLSSDANGDIYYRDAGILKRRAIGSTDQVLTVSGGLPVWSTLLTSKVILPIGAWNMDTTSNVNVTHGVDRLKVIGSTGVIYPDDIDVVDILFFGWSSFVDGVLDISINTVSPTVSQLSRTNAGVCDSANFDLTQYNLDAAAAVDKGGGLVGIPITSHTFKAGFFTTLAGTTNYNGDYTIVSVTANEIVITATYVAETFAGTETALYNRGWLVLELMN